MSERVHFRCPGCGSGLETPEGTISNLCTYCGLVSLLGRPGRIVKRYYQPAFDVLEARVIAERQIKKEGWPLFCDSAAVTLHYVPFYRFRGLSLSCLSYRRMAPSPTGLETKEEMRSYELRARNLDLTVAGCSAVPFGLSNLGIRPQAVSTWAYRDSELPADATVWPADRQPSDTQKDAFRMNEANLSMVNAGKVQEFCEMVGEHQSIIYFPVYVVEGRIGSDGRECHVVLDGLAKRVISATPEKRVTPLTYDPDKQVRELVPEAHRCPHCGADLPASERSIVYACSNCHRLWLLDAAGFSPLEAACVGEGQGGLYPFWRIKIAFSRHPGFDTVGAFSRLLTADVPLLDKRKRHLPFFVFVPAFAGADAEWQVLTAVRMSRTQPLVEPVAKLPREAASVSLAAPEALEFARFAWNWLRMNYLNLRAEHFDFRAAATGGPQLAWLPLQDERLGRSVHRAHQGVATAS